MSDFNEVILLERIDLIARLSTGYECQKSDKEIALIWIAELAREAMAYSDSEMIERSLQ